MNTIAVVQARLGSDRLPGKVLEEIGDRTVLEHTYHRALAVSHAVIACPSADVQALRNALGLIPWIAGSGGPEEDVLSRFAAVAESRPDKEVFIRLTADCPFVDVEGIKAVAQLVESGAADYATTNPGAGQLRIDGYDAEAFTRELLLAAHDNAITAYDREHVTPWIWREAKRPWHVYRDMPKEDVSFRPLRWTLDTEEDLAWFRAVAGEIDVTPPLHPTYEELMALLERRPDLMRTG